MDAPKLAAPIPPQVINEGAAFGPLDLKQYFTLTPDDESLYISAGLKEGKGLPDGLIVTEDGLFIGIPARKTEGTYDVVVTVENEAGEIESPFSLTIKPVVLTKADGAEFLDQLKSQVWKALGENAPLPDLKDIIERAVTPLDVYYLLERWGTLTIYDAYNLDSPGKKTALQLEGMNKHYHIYDRGCCLVSVPKDLFSHERTVADGMESARIMAREAYKRGWAMELVGYEKYSRSAWVELQVLGEEQGKQPEIINYNPTAHEVNLVKTTIVTKMQNKA